MFLTIRARRFAMAATLAVTAGMLAGLLTWPAQAGGEPYLGWDFGGGFGIGVGTPPSAYDPCPTYGWPVYPYRCGYYRPVYHYRHYRRHHRSRHYYR